MRPLSLLARVIFPVCMVVAGHSIPLIPLLVLLTIPGLLALSLRRRAGSRGASPLASPGWLSWIQLGAWLWWLVALPPSRIAALFSFLPASSGYLMLVGGALVFAVPPLVASAIALAVLRRDVDPEPPASGGLPGFLLRNLAPDF